MGIGNWVLVDVQKVQYFKNLNWVWKLFSGFTFCEKQCFYNKTHQEWWVRSLKSMSCQSGQKNSQVPKPWVASAARQLCCLIGIKYYIFYNSCFQIFQFAMTIVNDVLRPVAGGIQERVPDHVRRINLIPNHPFQFKVWCNYS